MRIHIQPTDPPQTLDRVASTFRDGAVEIVLAPGEYWTGGAWGAGANWERMQAPGVLLRPDNGTAKVSLADSAPRSLDGKPRPERDLRVWTYGHGARIQGITFDGRQAAFPDHFVTAGVRGVGGSEFEDVWVTGLRGRYKSPDKPGIEAFGISSIGPDGGSRWRRCGVKDCAENAYVSAFNVGHTGPSPARSELEKCVAEPGVGNWMGYGVNQNVDLIGCSSKNVVAHVYNDTAETNSILVDGGRATRVQKLLSLVSVDGSAKRGVTMSGVDCELVPDGKGDAWVIELWNQSNRPADLGDILMEQLSIESSAARTHVAIASPSAVRPVVVLSSRLPGSLVAPFHSSVLLRRCTS